MKANVLKDFASTVMLISSVGCVSLAPANSSDIIQIYDKSRYQYSSDTKEEYGNNTETDFSNSKMFNKFEAKEKSEFAVQYEAETVFGKMRDATVEEQKNVLESIKEISEPTGLNFWD